MSLEKERFAVHPMVCGKDGFKFIQLIVFLLLDVFLHHLLNNLFETDSEAFRK
jgi:hypothetical protein